MSSRLRYGCLMPFHRAQTVRRALVRREVLGIVGVGVAVVGIAGSACSSSSTTSGAAASGDGGVTTDPATGAMSCPGQNPPTGTGTLKLCEECGATFCCTEIEACSGDSTCPTLQTCLLRCEATDQGCISACDNLYPSSVTLYNNLSNCNAQECGQACTTPPIGCTAALPLHTTGGCAMTQFPLVWDCPSGPPEPQCVAAPSGVANEYCCLQ